MRSIRFRPALAGLALAALVAASALAPAQSPEETLVDVTLQDADLLTATRMLTQRTGLQFVIEPSSQPFGKININLKRQPASTAIRYICESAGAFFRRDENGVYIISRTKPVEPAPTDSKSNAKHVSIFRKIKLQKADAREVYEQILNINPYDPARRFAEMNRFGAVTNGRTKFLPPSAYMPKVSAPEMYTPMPLRSFQAPRTGSESGNDIQLPGEGAGQAGLGDDFGGGGQGFGNQGGGQGAGPGGGGQGIGQGGFMPPGIDIISFDPTDNSLVVQGTEEAITALQRIITEFDRAPKQVEVKVEFVTTRTTIGRGLGYDIRYQRGAVRFDSLFAPGGTPFFLSYAIGNMQFAVRQLLAESRGKSVQAPTIRTMNNQPAQISTTTSITLFTQQILQNPNGNIVVTVPQNVEIQTGLAVTPRINNDGTITMFLNPSLSDIAGVRRDPRGNEFPDIVSQTVSVVARVQNGETIALGGFNRKQNQESGGRYPVLSDLPLIGQFFRSRTVNREDQELIIFVTPTIVEEDETIGAANP